MAKQKRRDDDDDIIADVKGKPVMIQWFGYQPSVLFGSARLELTPTRILETSKFLFNSRETAFFLDDVQGAEIVSIPHPLYIIVGVFTMPLFGLGLLFFLLALIMRYKYLVIHYAVKVQVIGMTGKPEQYLDFRDAVLEEAERVRGAKSKSSAPAKSSRDYDDDDVAAPAPRIEAPVKNKVAAPAGDGKTTVKCPECSAEYKLPAGSTGKKFRCQKCQAVIET